MGSAGERTKVSLINNKVVKSTLVYFVGNVLSKAMMFFMLPLYTSRIPAGDMGLYDTGTTVITFFASVLFLDIGSTIMRYYLAAKSDDDKKASMTHGMTIFIMSTSLYCLILIPIGVIFEIEYYAWIVLYGLLYSANTVIGQCARAVGRNTDYAIAGIIQTFVLIIANIVLIIGFNFDYSALLISFCVSTMVSTVYLLIRSSLNKYISVSLFDKKQFLDIFKFTLPLCVNSIAFWFLSSSGRVILRYMNGPEQVGYLSIAGKFNQIIYLVSSCVQMTWQEIAYAHDNDNQDVGTFYSKAFGLYYKVMIMGVALIVPAIRIALTIFPNFINATYAESINLIPDALLGTGLAIVSLFSGTIFSSVKKTNVIFISTLTGALVSVGSNILFILSGLNAASVNYSFILGYVTTITMRILILSKNMNFRVKAKDLLVPIIAFVCVSTIYSKLSFAWSFLGFAIALLLSAWLFKSEIAVFIKKYLKKSEEI